MVMVFLTGFVNVKSFMQLFRPILIFWCLVEKSANRNVIYSILDFVCEEFLEEEVTNSQSEKDLKKERKNMITNNFAQLLQFWRFHDFENQQIWKMCEEYCDFREEDVRNCISIFRKDVVYRLIIVGIDDFSQKQSSKIMEIIKKTYESLHRGGRQFSIGAIVEYRSEGLDLLAIYRSYMTQNRYFYQLKSQASRSFAKLLPQLSQQFFDENWWSILLILRHISSNHESVWKLFIERLDYSNLRLFLWRIVADISRIPSRCCIKEKINLTIWNRLNFAGKLENDSICLKYFWIIPKSCERDFVKLRKFEDLLQLMSEFEKYPITLYFENIRFYIERGNIWKYDLPRLVNSLISMIVKCENEEQQKEVGQILKTIPILSSCQTDTDFIRWDMSAEFYQNPGQRTQCLLDECVLFIEKISVDADFLEFSDRTLCEIARYIDVNNCEDPMRKITGESVKIFYSRMNCTAKPDPQNLVQPQSLTFELWLTRKIIASCIVEEDDPQFVSFLPISNVKNVGFLTKLAGKFLIHAICKKRENVLQNILTEFEQCLHNAISQRTTRLERRTATFVFYIFDFLYFYSNQKYLQKSQKSEVDEFCKRIIMNTIKDEHGHDIPLIVKVAEKFGMEKRAILWMEMFMELKMENAKGEEIKHVETSAYFVLMNLYARIGGLNGVTGSYNRLSKNQVDHIFAKILLNEAHGKLSEANVLYRFVEQKRASEPLEIVQNALENVKYDEEEEEECKDYENCLKSLTKWDSFENIETPQVFDRNLEMNARIARIFTSENSLDLLEKEKSRTILRMTEEAAIGGNCSYETAIPYIVEMKCFEEIEQIRNASMDELMDVEAKFWNGLTKQTEESEQHSEYLEPILRCRRLAIIEKMHKMSEKEREKLKTIIVDTHLHSARLSRLRGCFETAQISILHAKEVQPFNKRIVLEEAKLQLQTSDDEAGMILLNSLLATTFGELSKHFGDSQQCSNIDLKNTAKMQIESFQTEEKNLYSSVQMLRISHLIRLGNTITFEKIYEETNNLLSSFVSSGVMYEAAWLLDYLNQFSEKSKTCLPLLKAYKEVAKYEKNRVLQARAVERMTSLWLEYSKKLSQVIAKKTTANDLPKRMSDMNHEMKNAMSTVGWRAFYPAYAILARKIDHEDQDVFLTMKRMMIQLIIRLPHQCMWQSVHILRSEDAKKIEKYREVLNDVKLKHRGYSRIFEQYDFASATFKNVPEKMRSSDSELSKVVPDIKMMIHSKKYNPKQLEIDRRGEGEQEMSCGIMIPIRSDIDSSVIEQSEENPEDLDYRYLIHDYSEKVKILSSLTKPVIIEIMTMAGRKIRLILKKDDDLTKDYHFTKMVEMCNDLLAKDEVTRISNLSATTYSVIPLAKTGGIIEFMDGCSTYFEALEEYMNLKSEQMNQHIREMRNKTGKEEKLRYFREDWCKDTPLVMAKWFRIQYPEAGKWYSSRKLFAKSCAVMSIIGFIFGLGDRHTRNVMIHLPTGKCVHVDFDMVFNLGEFLDVPEVVPFRLTRNMVNGMGEVALEGEFRVVCEQTLRVFRENAYEIEKYISDLPDLVSSPKLSAAIAKIQNETGNRDFKYDMKLAKQFISGRLRGQIMTARIYKSHAVSHPLSAVQMSASLIELAKNEEKLVEMFHGWMPNV
ncbi:unnamed protein product [Caenorhabditis angaria]|uniref:non-specific serine/threonine protein kinase n=1 Tax=Caenorhabditis angaria TaxID=860376 RepID=A0A9P1MT40_9PELO|nr:unnamed protein product [Caenorhabditis angaria]